MILQGSRRFVEVLEHCAALGLPGWYLAAGCVTQTVWNHLTGRSVDGGIRDYDLLRLVVRTSLVLAPTDPRSTRTPGPWPPGATSSWPRPERRAGALDALHGRRLARGSACSPVSGSVGGLAGLDLRRPQRGVQPSRRSMYST